MSTDNTNLTDKEIEELKKEHPDWIINGKLYLDPDERAKAKAEYDKLAEEAKKKQEEEDKKRKEDLLRYETTRGVVIGSDASVELNNENLKELVGGIDLNAALGNAEEIKKRQHLLDPTNYYTEIKTPNPGKPPNNEDPFPVDLKIEELEVHKPDIKIYRLDTPVEGQVAAEAAMKVSDTAEKRIIKLENMMATLTRYLFRLGSRMQINCVYYGGQTTFNKYACIRCLNDNRIQDGQNVQIDQCLNCTRYEPVFGQCYELLNDLGVNVASILDDNQMSYTNMESYIEQNRSENYHTETEKASIDLSTVTTKIEKSYNDKDFKTRWGNGIQMKWDLVPKEQQKPHINWRQSINDDGSHLKRLASFPQNESNMGANIVNNSAYQNVFKKNKEEMDKSCNTKLSNWISTGQKSSESINDELINKIKGGWAQEIRTAINGQKGLDALAIACCAFISQNDINSIISKLVDIIGVTRVDNPALNISAYMAGINAIMGYNDIPRIDKVVKSSDDDDKNKSTSGTTETYHLNWDNRDTWYWTEFAEPLSINAKANNNGDINTIMSFFPQVCYLYCALLPYCKTSEYDGDWAAFPFTDEEISQGLYFTSKFGYRGERMHHGIDLECTHGTPIHAIQDGIVIDPSGWGSVDCNAVIIDHGNGIYSKYLHCASHAVNVGATVAKGDIVAYVGGWGNGHDGTYTPHLHLEIGPESLAGSSQNPIDYYPFLSGYEPERGNHYYDLKNKQMY